MNNNFSKIKVKFRIMKKYLIFLPLLFLLILSIRCSKPDYQTVTIASGGHAVHFLPLDIAVAKGFFEEEGLKPDIKYISGGSNIALALITKTVDFSANSIDHVIKAQLQGKDFLKMVVLLNQTPGMNLVMHKKYKGLINTPADIKGKRLGVSSLGSATHMVLNFILNKYGIKPDEVEVIKAGVATFVPALVNENIDGGMAVEPFVGIMLRNGDAYSILDLNSMEDTKKVFGGPYNTTGILTRDDVIEEKPVIVQKVVNIMVKALKWIDSHSPEEIASVLPEEVTGSDKNAYIETMRNIKDFYTKSGEMDIEGFSNVLKALETFEDKSKLESIEISSLIDSKFLSDKKND